jgi:hypothetical protein
VDRDSAATAGTMARMSALVNAACPTDLTRTTAGSRHRYQASLAFAKLTSATMSSTLETVRTGDALGVRASPEPAPRARPSCSAPASPTPRARHDPPQQDLVFESLQIAVEAGRTLGATELAR